MDSSLENNSIQNPEEALSAPVDYRTLRKLGLEAIIRVGSEHWTDYNEHDPGITILEALIFALTDLGYRTTFPIEDILAQQQQSAAELATDKFYTARSILTVNPLSLTDFRKLIIDLEGVDNAWVYRSQQDFNPVKGLMNIIVDANAQILEDSAKEKRNSEEGPTKKERLIQTINDTFYKHRNLSHDLGQIILRNNVLVYFSIELTIEQEAISEEVVAQVNLQLEHFLVNAVQFLSLQEMMDKFDQDINQVFDGPPLKHGFLPDDALKPAITNLRSVDLIPVLSNVPGVLRVDELKFRTSLDVLNISDSLEKIPKWFYQKALPKYCKPVLALLDQQMILIKKGDRLSNWDPSIVFVEYNNLKNNQRAAKLAPEDRDIPIPMGKFRDLTQYDSIQQEFPRIYGLDSQPSPVASESARLAQIKQLKAYLLIFDQILANYLAQLAHLGDLFSWSPEVKRTYYFQGLETSVNNIGELLQNYPTQDAQGASDHREQLNSDAARVLEQYLSKLGEFRENDKTFLQRRNRFLSHLLARFGRQLTFYTARLEKTALNNELQQEVELATKLNVLGNYADLSAQRGRAFNIRKGKEDFPKEFSGLRRWVETLFDMTPETIDVFNFNDRFFEGNYDVVHAEKNPMSEYTLVTADGSAIDFKELMRIGTKSDNYQLESNWPHNNETGETQKYNLSLFKLENLSQKATVYQLAQTFQRAEDGLAAIDQLTALFQKYNHTSERVYLVEHLLLRPLPEEKFFGLELLDEKEVSWLKTNSWYSSDALSEIEQMIEQDYAYYHISYPQVNPIIMGTGQIEETGSTTIYGNQEMETGTTEDFQSRFNFSIKLSDTGEYQVELDYIGLGQPISLKSVTPSQSEWQAANSIEYWMRTLAKFTFIVQQKAPGQYRIHLSHGPKGCCIDFESIQQYYRLEDAEEVIRKWKKEPAFFNLFVDSANTGLYQVYLVYETSGLMVQFQSTVLFDSENEANIAKDQWQQILKNKSGGKKILQKRCKSRLRPWPWHGAVSKDSSYEFVYNDPFSFMMTVVIPDWPCRFQEKGFKEALQQVLQAEAPAHLWLNVLWLPKARFQYFRFLFGNWWRAYVQDEPGVAYFRKTLMDFIMTHSFVKEA